MIPRKASALLAVVALVAASVIVGAISVVVVSSITALRATDRAALGCSGAVQYAISDVQVNSTGGIRARILNTGPNPIGDFTLEAELHNGTVLSLRAASPPPAATISTSQGEFVIASQGAPLENLVRSVRVLTAACAGVSASRGAVSYRPFG